MGEYKIVIGDVLETTKQIKPERFDGILCDPPYALRYGQPTRSGKDWDKALPPTEVWAELLRVCKPGAHLLAFGNPRTHHRLMCNVEDAGWMLRDVLSWNYGSGFPKSMNVGKAIAKATGKEPEAEQWGGYGTALKPAWEPIVLAQKPVCGTYVNNALEQGCGGLNVDECRIATSDKLGGGRLSGPTNMTETCGGPEWDRPWMHDEEKKEEYVARMKEKVEKAQQLGRWPANFVLTHHAECAGDACHPACPTAILDKQSEGASRFFYCTKAARSERGEGNDHPTLKPLKLTEYLAKLILPPRRDTKRQLVVPFSGSGSEMIGALRGGWDKVIGIELEKKYVKIAYKRLLAEGE
jgi:site-specific DNA-methyltransferase (adenine-specific)